MVWQRGRMARTSSFPIPLCRLRLRECPRPSTEGYPQTSTSTGASASAASVMSMVLAFISLRRLRSLRLTPCFPYTSYRQSIPVRPMVLHVLGGLSSVTDCTGCDPIRRVLGTPPRTTEQFSLSLRGWVRFPVPPPGRSRFYVSFPMTVSRREPMSCVSQHWKWSFD